MYGEAHFLHKSVSYSLLLRARVFRSKIKSLKSLKSPFSILSILPISYLHSLIPISILQSLILQSLFSNPCLKSSPERRKIYIAINKPFGNTGTSYADCSELPLQLFGDQLVSGFLLSTVWIDRPTRITFLTKRNLHLLKDHLYGTKVEKTLSGLSSEEFLKSKKAADSIYPWPQRLTKKQEARWT